MKALSTIQREIRRLRRISEDAKVPPQTRSEAYVAWHTLRWVIENVSWRPSGVILRAARGGE